jgi:hypothetical protein
VPHCFGVADVTDTERGVDAFRTKLTDRGIEVSCFRLAITIRAPWAPKMRQISLPIPVAPPVTKATRPSKRPGAKQLAPSVITESCTIRPGTKNHLPI